MNEATREILSDLREAASPEKAEWWNSYLKGAIPFLGVGTPEIRQLFLERNQEHAFAELSMNKQVSLVNSLMRGNYAEEKLAAILYVQLFWLERMNAKFLMNLIDDWFDDRHIYDWNTCDWLCVRVLTPLVDSADQRVIWKLKLWNRDSYLWKARASVVAFAQSRYIAQHEKEIAQFSDILIRRKERFAKTAVGWVLREYSRENPEFVLDFLARHAAYVTGEVKRNALKYYRKEII